MAGRRWQIKYDIVPSEDREFHDASFEITSKMIFENRRMNFSSKLDDEIFSFLDFIQNRKRKNEDRKSKRKFGRKSQTKKSRSKIKTKMLPLNGVLG